MGIKKRIVINYPKVSKIQVIKVFDNLINDVIEPEKHVNTINELKKLKRQFVTIPDSEIYNYKYIDLLTSFDSNKDDVYVLKQKIENITGIIQKPVKTNAVAVAIESTKPNFSVKEKVFIRAVGKKLINEYIHRHNSLIEEMNKVKMKRIKLEPKKIFVIKNDSNTYSDGLSVSNTTMIISPINSELLSKDDKRSKDDSDDKKENEYRSDVKFGCYYNKKESVGSNIVIDFAVFEKAFKSDVEDMLKNDKYKYTGNRRIEKGKHYDVVLTSSLIDTVIEKGFDWNGEYEIINFEVKIPEYCPQKINFKFTVRMEEIEIASILFCVDILGGYIPEIEIKKNKAFFSYSRKDINKVIVIKKIIESIEIYESIFLDVDNLKHGQKWIEEVEKAIDYCNFYYLFWSNNSKESVYVKQEFDIMRSKNNFRELKLIPLIPIESANDLPPELRENHYDNNLAKFLKKHIK